VPGWVRAAREAHQSCVVLATGDPLCHGIAPYLAQRLCLDALEILPNLSTLQLACARVGLAWQDARIVSVHSKPTQANGSAGAPPSHGLYALAQALRQQRLLLLTSPANCPDRIARLLLAEGLGSDFHMAVAEDLLQPDEQVHAQLSPAEAASMRFAELNVVLLWRTRPRPQPVRFGLADSAYEQRQPEKGLITKQEVRAVSLARLQLRADSVVWDIGAGSGSVGLEAARLCPQGHVWAIEKNEADHAIARRNHAALASATTRWCTARRPRAWRTGPTPTQCSSVARAASWPTDRPVPAPPAARRLAGDELCHAGEPGHRHPSPAAAERRLGTCCNCRRPAANPSCTCTAWRPKTRCGSGVRRRAPWARRTRAAWWPAGDGA
jgi:precorrin-6Y C5,15-methyltransferase (decarboxylating)